MAPFFILIWMSLFSALRFPKSQAAELIARYVTLGVVIVLSVGIMWLAGRSFFRAAAPKPFVDWEVAEGLHEMGVKPGEEIGSMGYSQYCYWAHLAGVRIIAEIPTNGAPIYWASSPQVQSEVLSDFAKSGARVVVADQGPPGGAARGWNRIGQTSYYVRDLADVLNGHDSKP